MARKVLIQFSFHIKCGAHLRLVAEDEPHLLIVGHMENTYNL